MAPTRGNVITATGERQTGAESAGDRRPSNLIRVMPAKGVEFSIVGGSPGAGRTGARPRSPS
jgi:hypothetical protein